MEVCTIAKNYLLNRTCENCSNRKQAGPAGTIYYMCWAEFRGTPFAWEELPTENTCEDWRELIDKF